MKGSPLGVFLQLELPIVVDIPQPAVPRTVATLIRRLELHDFEHQTFMNDHGDLVTEIWRRSPPIAARIVSRGGRFVEGTLHESLRHGYDEHGRAQLLAHPLGMARGITAIAAALTATAR